MFNVAVINTAVAFNSQIETKKASEEAIYAERRRNYALSQINEIPTQKKPCWHCGRTTQKFRATTCGGCGGEI